MKPFGVFLAVFGALSIVVALANFVMGNYDLSESSGLQKFIGGLCFGILLAALGLKLANDKKPTPPNDKKQNQE
jgi:hypothetical protein